jgi:hypothetical protein
MNLERRAGDIDIGRSKFFGAVRILIEAGDKQ